MNCIKILWRKDELSESEGQRRQIELSTDVEEDVRIRCSDSVFFADSNITVVEVMPAATVRSVSSVMSRAQSGPMMYDDSSKIVEGSATGASSRLML